MIVYQRTKFQVCSISRSGDIEGVPKFKIGHVMPLFVLFYVIFYLVDISVKFRDDRYIGC